MSEVRDIRLWDTAEGAGKGALRMVLHRRLLQWRLVREVP
jgi:hypothetical protein